MKAVIQRVNFASVSYNNIIEEISKGIVIFVGIKNDDTEKDIEYLVRKIVNLRIFENNNKMDKSVLDIDGDVLIVSEFTLYGDCSKGNRPDFTSAAKPEFAELLYKKFVDEFKKYLPKEKIKTGKFREHMLVEIHNDGPVTIILETNGGKI
jgi:D-tyrosyl-tRNA(Tyr) deacylase